VEDDLHAIRKMEVVGTTRGSNFKFDVEQVPGASVDTSEASI
jgi:hypothetical protein